MRFLVLAAGVLGAATAARAIPINYTFNLTTLLGPSSTLTISANEDPAVQIQLSALAGTVQTTALGAGVLSSVGDTIDIEGGDRLIITPVVATFVGPYTFVSATFGNVDTGNGNSGDQTIPHLDGVAGATVVLPVSPTAISPNSVFNTSVGFQNNDGNDDFRGKLY